MRINVILVSILKKYFSKTSQNTEKIHNWCTKGEF